jgi:hypothetical protein
VLEDDGRGTPGLVFVSFLLFDEDPTAVAFVAGSLPAMVGNFRRGGGGGDSTGPDLFDPRPQYGCNVAVVGRRGQLGRALARILVRLSLSLLAICPDVAGGLAVVSRVLGRFSCSRT